MVDLAVLYVVCNILISLFSKAQIPKVCKVTLLLVVVAQG